MEIKGKVALVTGASSGIGRAIAREFLDAGALVVLASRNREKLEALGRTWIEQDPALKSQILIQSLDVRDEVSCREVVRQVRERWGRLHILVNNAGYTAMGPLKDFPIQEAQALFETNFFGAARMSLAAFPLLVEAGQSCIVMISSIASQRGLPWLHYYCATKAAMNSLAQSINVEWRAYGVRALTVMPGITQSDIVSNGKYFGGAKLPSVYPGHTAAQVARMTLNAVKADKRELICGINNQISVFVRRHLFWIAEPVLGRIFGPWDRTNDAI